MKLTPNELIKKFPFLKQYKDLNWLNDLTIKRDESSKKLPYVICMDCLDHLCDFMQSTKFKSHWEFSHSVKIRINQINDLLKYLKEDSPEEKTVKNNDQTSSL